MRLVLFSGGSAGSALRGHQTPRRILFPWGYLVPGWQPFTIDQSKQSRERRGMGAMPERRIAPSGARLRRPASLARGRDMYSGFLLGWGHAGTAAFAGMPPSPLRAANILSDCRRRAIRLLVFTKARGPTWPKTTEFHDSTISEAQ